MKLMMRRKNVLRLSFLIALLALLWSCRNEDFAQAEKNSQRNNQDFFKHTKNNDAFARAGVDYIDILDAYNKEKDFLAQMPDQQGMPIWEKMQIVDSENITGLMIPLSHDNEAMSSVLFATLDKKNSVIGAKDYDNTLLEKIVYDAKISRDFREQIFSSFMYMDNKTFGTQYFTNIPQDLFVGEKYDDKNGRMLIKDFDTPGKSSYQNKLLIQETCKWVWNCKKHETWSKCDHCMDCHEKVCHNIAIYSPDEPTVFPDGGDEGGGGTPGSGGPRPTDPCAPTGINKAFYRMLVGCQGNGSGNDDVLDDPCEKTKTLLAKPDVKAKIDLLEEQSKKSGDDRGEKAFLYMNDNTPSTIIEGEDHQVNLAPYSGYKGVYHNHTPIGTKMLAPYDILTLYQTAVYQLNSTTATQGFIGMVAYETCNCTTSNFVYHNYIIRFNGDYSTTGAIANLSEEKMKQLQDDFGALEMKLLGIPSLRNSPSLASNLNAQGLERLFFGTLAKMNIDPNQIILQKIEKDGTIYNINLNPDGSTTPVPCP